MLKLLYILPLVIVVFVGCGKENNPVSPGDGEHTEAVGCVIKQGDIEIVRASKGEVTGSFSVAVNTVSPVMNFYLVAQDDDLFQPDEEHAHLDWVSGNPQITDIVQNDKNAKWDFQITGLQSGTTTVQFKLMHDDHADFVSLDIPVTVAPGNGL